MILKELKKQFASSNNSVIQLIWINSLVFFAISLTTVILELFVLPTGQSGLDLIYPYIVLNDEPSTIIKYPWTIFTTFFSHIDMWHLASNMLFLYFIGLLFTPEFGHRRLIILYIAAGFGANLFYILVQNTVPYFMSSSNNLIGASGAIVSLLIYYATIYPNREVSLFMVLKVKMVWIAVVYVAIFVISLNKSNSGGEVCHIGGVIIGYIFGTFYKKGIDLTHYISNLEVKIIALFKPKPNIKVSHSNYNNPSRSYGGSITHRAPQAQIDSILDKVKISGYASLSKEEKQILFDFSNK